MPKSPRLTSQTRPDSCQRPRSIDPDDTFAGLSARTDRPGLIEEVRVDGLLAQLYLRVGGQSLTAVIAADVVQALKLRTGDDAIAVVKSIELMIARPSCFRSATLKVMRGSLI